MKTNNKIQIEYTSLESSIGNILYLIFYSTKRNSNFKKITDLRLNNTKEAENLIKIHSFTFADKFTISTGFWYCYLNPNERSAI